MPVFLFQKSKTMPGQAFCLPGIVLQLQFSQMLDRHFKDFFDVVVG